MLVEWIKILGLDGEDPPWEEEPREIRAIACDGKRVVMVKVKDINREKWLAEVSIESCEEYDEEEDKTLEQNLGGVWVDLESLYQITVVY